MADIILDLMESVALIGRSGRLSSRHLEILNYILEQLKDLDIMSFIRMNQIYEMESEK